VCGESNSGDDAIENYERARPDVLIVAATLPSMDGIATIIKLKHKYPNASAMLAASAGQRSVVVEAISAGAVDFIAKPFAARRVIATLRKHFG
jgi:two-component system chemotaxis response regulator CheY